ncbi:MAG: hypothetical protein A3I75_08020 [Deltaproteobacteria bacterium RIFCSPLOWO2_02_FULL_50_16]|nr:MAG: hypothetical protein A2053_03615 [Deltaproteobacteria bacterium GWA2_50_8]OGQ28565.1 MAG: hypothetical protein A3B79_01970 [Deltaproteobacteria bacterium RIFCSPHIGHO2_02_FULL_50_15]OGQ56004.1 MAG: hypothetical protein A3I75_08020 [Deltaproteobacteria bacterium RIFCSPLOWO2_02_FULL_50_16]
MKTLVSEIQSGFKKYFIAGLVTLIPIAVTLWFLKTVIIWADGFFKVFLPPLLYPERLIGRHIPGVGIVVTVTFVFLIGVLTRLYFGKKILNWWDQLFSKIPLGKGIYKGAKQFLGTIITADKKAFKQVALIQYPREGMWAFCFVTSEVTGGVRKDLKEKHYYVFMPTTPNPTSGFLLLVPEKNLLIVDVPVDEAIRIIISGGVVTERSSMAS